MAFDYLTQLTDQTQGFALSHSADDPLTHAFSLGAVRAAGDRDEGIAFDPNDPASFTTTVFGGAITAFSPRQNHSLAIARPPDGLSVAV
jgi:hypothetical protein